MRRFSSAGKTALALFLLTLALSSDALAGPPHGDFDGDGLPDLVAIQKFKKGSVRTRWIVRLSSTNTNRNYDFKLSGDAMVVQRRNGRSYPGIVNVEKAKRPLRWSIYQPDGTVYNFKWNRPGATITQAGDFDGNGIDDCVAVTNGKWDIALDCNPGNVRTFIWGNAGEAFRVYNDQVLDVAAAYVLRNVNGNLRWISRTLNGVSRDLGFGLATDIPVGVEAFNGHGTVKHLAVARRTSTGMVMYLGNSSGTITRNLGTNSGIPFVGVDHVRGFYGIYDRATALSALVRLTGPTTFIQHGGSSYWFVAPDGTVYPVGADANAIGGGSGGGGGSGPPANFNSCTKWLDVTDGHGKGFTWNNAASKGEKVILPTDYIQNYTVSSVKLYYPDGTLYRDVVFFGYEDSRQRWYVYDTKSNGTGVPKNAVVVINLINDSYYNLGPGPHCAHLPNPAQRYD